MHICSVFKHRWTRLCVASYPLAELQLHLSSEGIVVFESNHMWKLVLASKFVKQTKSQVVYLATVEQIESLNVMHRAAHGSDVEHCFKGSTKLLAKLEQEYPRMFAEPEFSIIKHRAPFSYVRALPASEPCTTSSHCTGPYAVMRYTYT